VSDSYTGERANPLEVDAWFKHKQFNVFTRESIHNGNVTLARKSRWAYSRGVGV